MERVKNELRGLIEDEVEIEDGTSVSRRQREKLVEAVDQLGRCEFEELELAAERVGRVAVRLSEIVGEIDEGNLAARADTHEAIDRGVRQRELVLDDIREENK